MAKVITTKCKDHKKCIAFIILLIINWFIYLLRMTDNNGFKMADSDFAVLRNPVMSLLIDHVISSLAMSGQQKQT